MGRRRDKDDYSFRREVERKAGKEKSRARQEEKRRQERDDRYNEPRRGLIRRILDRVSKDEEY